MPEYTALTLAVMLVAAAAAVATGLHRRTAAWLTLAVFLIATAVFDGYLIANGVILYATWSRTGISVGPAPIEDLGFGAALCLIAMATWTAASRRTP